MIVMIVEGKRYLINEESPAGDKACKDILDSYPPDAVVDSDEVRMSDVKRKTLKDLMV